jgi:hypothetical protein
VLATGSSPYQVFSVARLWAFGVARVPIRRILTNVLVNMELYIGETEYLLMGGQRWRFVYGLEMLDEMRPVLDWLDAKTNLRNSVQHRIMQIWERMDDEDVDSEMHALWRELKAAHEQR